MCHNCIRRIEQSRVQYYRYEFYIINIITPNKNKLLIDHLQCYVYQ